MNRTSKKVEKAYELAKEYYKDILLDDGSKYFDYVENVYNISRSENEKIVTLLMGTLKYNILTPHDLLFNFGPTVRDAVITLTPLADESYPDYLLRIKTNPISRAVKIAENKYLLTKSDISEEEFDKQLDVLIS